MGRRRKERNAGHRLFKTRTQRHRMLGKNWEERGKVPLPERKRGFFGRG